MKVYLFLLKVVMHLIHSCNIFYFQDFIPEADERFLVNITGVSLMGMTPAPGSEPSIRIPGNVVVVTISENDNAKGIVQFNVTTVSIENYSYRTGILLS